MSEFSDSIAEAIRKRVTSASLGTYVFFWLAFHWEGVYTTLFTSQEIIFQKFGLLKNEYVREYFFGWHGWETVISYVLPLVLTILFIWPIPKYIIIHAYRQEQRYKVTKRRIRIEEEEVLQQARKDLAVKEKEAVQAEVKVSKEIKKASKDDPTILWGKELVDFVNQPSGGATLQQLKITMYQDNGHLTNYRTSAGAYIPVSGMSVESLALADTNNLISMSKKDQTIELTEKGKYFLARMAAAIQ